MAEKETTEGTTTGGKYLTRSYLVENLKNFWSSIKDYIADNIKDFVNTSSFNKVLADKADKADVEKLQNP